MADVEASERPVRDSERSRDRSKSKDRRRRSRSRDRERRRSRSRDRRKSRSRSRERRPSRSRSKSPAGYDPNRKRRRPTWFDIPPVGGLPPPISSLPGAVGVTPSVPAPGTVQSAGGNQQATRHARRIYVGGLPPHAGENLIADFFSNALAAVGGTTAGPGPCVVNVYINMEKKFAFVELRTVEEASNAMALDGIMFEGVTVRIRRPADYNPAAAAALGPAAPNPNLNLAAIGLDKMREQQAAAAAAAAMAMPAAPAPAPMSHLPEPNVDRLFIGGLPYYLNDEQCRELLSAFGVIKTFDLIKDRETGLSKGYAFCLYEDVSITDLAIQGLHGMKMGDRQLTVRRADQGARNAQPVVPAQMAPDGAFQPAMFTSAAPRVVKLSEAVSVDELANDEDYNDIMEDMREECGKFGAVKEVLIPRPAADPSQPPPPGLGKVFVEFAEPQAALAARNAMHGRRFAGRTVQAALVTEEDWSARKLD